MKAILVIDVEDNGTYYADVYRKDEDDRFEGRYYLKPMPKKKNIYQEIGLMTDVMMDVIDLTHVGWNACIDAITGETE